MKKIVYIVLIVILATLLAVFVSQNSAPFTIHFLSWEFNFYGGLVIIFSFLLGILVMSLIWAFTILHKRQLKIHDTPDMEHEVVYSDPDNA